MKIVHIITRLIVGGAQENTLLSCEGQHRLGHDVTLITGPSTGPEGSLMDRARASGIRVIELDAMRRSILPRKDLATFRELVRMLRELKPDVVHTHSSKAGIIGRLAARWAKAPVIIHTIHGLAFTASTSKAVNYAYRLAEKAVAPISTRIVCVADAMAEQSLAASIGRRKQYATVYSGMETHPFIEAQHRRDVVRARLGLKEGDIAIGTIARLFHLKGHEDLVAIAPQLCARFSKLKFLWIGDGILRRDYEAQIEEVGLKDRFILTGLVRPDEVPDLTSAMDILVHPSRREGLARALPQGALAGCPVVTYDIDGNREGLLDGKTGFLIEPFDINALEQALSRLLEDPGLRQMMGTRGRTFALGRFDTQVMVEGLEKVYAECICEKRRKHGAGSAPPPTEIRKQKTARGARFF